MPILNDLELPIKKTKIDGPAVRSLATRKEDNNGERATVEKFRASYANVKDQVLSGLKTIASPQAAVVILPPGKLGIMMNGDHLDIHASVGLEGLKQLQTMLKKYQEILEMMAPEKDVLEGF